MLESSQSAFFFPIYDGNVIVILGCEETGEFILRKFQKARRQGNYKSMSELSPSYKEREQTVCKRHLKIKLIK